MPRFDWILTTRRAARPGDLVRLRTTDSLTLADSTLDFVTVWFPALPRRGIARVIDTTAAPPLMEIWSRRVLVTRPDGTFRPLNRLGRWLAFDLWGQAMFRRELARAAPPPGDPNLPEPAPAQARMAAARGGLPLMIALGGRFRGYLSFWLHRARQQALRHLVGYPDPGALDASGVLIDHCTALLTFTYSGKPRRMRLDQLRRHPNGKFHFVGRLLPTGEARTFSAQGMMNLRINAGPVVNFQQLWVEMHALTSGAATHHRIWADWCRTNGLPMPPAPGLGARAEAWLARRGSRLYQCWLRLRHPELFLYTPSRWTRLRHWALSRLRPWYALRRRLQLALTQMQPRPASRRDLVAPDARWRKRCRDAAYWIERGRKIDPRDLRHLKLLARDPLFARALLRAMLRFEAQRLPPDHPAQLWLWRALDHLPPNRRILTWSDQTAGVTLVRKMDTTLTEAAACRETRLAQDALVAVHGYWFTPAILADALYPPQRIRRPAFLCALEHFTTQPRLEGQAFPCVVTPAFTLASAARLRWLAGFSPDD